MIFHESFDSNLLDLFTYTLIVSVGYGFKIETLDEDYSAIFLCCESNSKCLVSYFIF